MAGRGDVSATGETCRRVGVLGRRDVSALLRRLVNPSGFGAITKLCQRNQLLSANADTPYVLSPHADTPHVSARRTFRPF